MFTMTKDEKRVFWTRVRKTEGCWFWLGNEKGGYGRFTLRGKDYRAHRISYWITHPEFEPRSKMTDGPVIDHICRVPLCVNPDHLREVTRKENVPTKTHCLNGHELSGDNIYTYTYHGVTYRICKICNYNRTKQYRRDEQQRRLKGIFA